MSGEEIMAVSFSADFRPERLEDALPGDENTIHWIFQCCRKQVVTPGVYRLEYVRSLAEEKALGNPVLGQGS